MPSVSSEAIAFIGWTPSVKNLARRFVTGQQNLREALFNGTLEIQFHERGTYEYYDVPATTWLALQGAGSIGRYFNDNIRDRFRYSRIG